MRTSKDQIKNGLVFNGYDYALQVWVKEGKIQNCNHPAQMNCGCAARILQGLEIDNVKGAEVRKEEKGIPMANMNDLDKVMGW